MLSIFICDDNPAWIEKISNTVSTFELHNNIALKTHFFTSPEALLKDHLRYVGDQNAYFLDIDFGQKHMNGLELAQMIRKTDPNGHIVFVTTHEEMLPSTFKYMVSALGFVYKDSDNVTDEINDCLLRVSELISTPAPLTQLLSITSSDSFAHSLDIEKIICIECSKGTHSLRVFLTNGSYDIRSTLSDILSQLNDNFIRCGRSVIINKAYVTSVSINRVVTMSNGARFRYTADDFAEFSKSIKQKQS